MEWALFSPELISRPVTHCLPYAFDQRQRRGLFTLPLLMPESQEERKDVMPNPLLYIKSSTEWMGSISREGLMGWFIYRLTAGWDGGKGECVSSPQGGLAYLYQIDIVNSRGLCGGQRTSLRWRWMDGLQIDFQEIMTLSLLILGDTEHHTLLTSMLTLFTLFTAERIGDREMESCPTCC